VLTVCLLCVTLLPVLGCIVFVWGCGLYHRRCLCKRCAGARNVAVWPLGPFLHRPCKAALADPFQVWHRWGMTVLQCLLYETHKVQMPNRAGLKGWCCMQSDDAGTSAVRVRKSLMHCWCLNDPAFLVFMVLAVLHFGMRA
jgi:hypothetical protein